MVRRPSRRLVSPFCLPLSLPTCVPVMVCLPDGLSAFQRSCLPLSPLVSNCLPTIYVCVGWCVRLPKVLSPLVVFHCLPPPFLFPFLGWCAHVSPIVPHSLPLSPHMCALCWMVCPSCRSLISHCLPLPPQMVCPASRCLFPNCLPLSPHVCLCWMVRPPSRGLVSPSLPLSPLSRIVSHTCACVGWCVRLFDVLSSLFVSHCLPTCVPVLGGVLSCLPVLDGLSAFPRSCLPLSPIVSSPCAFVLDGVSAFPRPCLPFCLPPFLFPLLGWCARLFKVLSPLISHCSILSIVSPQVCLCWRVCPPSRGLVSPCLPSCLSLSPVVSNCFALSAIVSTCPTLSPNMCACVGWSTFPKSCFSSSPIVSLDMRACVGWCVHASRGLVSPCLPTCVPVLAGASALDGVSAFPRYCLPLSACVPEVLSPLVFHCLPLSSQLPPIVSLLVSPSPVVSGCVSLFPSVSPHVCLCWMVRPSSEVLSPHCLPLSSQLVPVLDGVSGSPWRLED